MADIDVQAGKGPAGNKERWVDQTGGVYAKLVAAVIAAGSAVIGQVSIDQTTPGTTNRVAAGGVTVPVWTEKTRTADTTAYTANDAWTNATSGAANWAFAVGRIATGSGIIVGAHISCDQSTYTTRFELDLYAADTAAVPQDNAEATRLYTDSSKFLGTILFPAMAKKTTNSNLAEAANADARVPFKCVGASSIYGVLRTLDAIATPVSGAKIKILLNALQD